MVRPAIVCLAIGALTGLVVSGDAQATTEPLLSGHWTMDKTVIRKSATLQEPAANGVRFIFVRTCNGGRCAVNLKTPLAKGGFDTDRMFR